MIFYTIYETASGKILYTGNCLTEQEVQNITSPSQSYLLQISNGNQYVENGELVDYPPKPEGYYTFDYDTKQWVPDSAAAAADAISKRDALLKESDWTQLPDVPLTQEQKAAWATYRQQLRDIPEQSGYPYNINWPIPPQ